MLLRSVVIVALVGAVAVAAGVPVQAQVVADEAEVADTLRTPGNIERFWQACCLPDFRQAGVDTHSRFVARQVAEVPFFIVAAPALLERIGEQGWHVELHRQVADIPVLVRALQPYGLDIVIDHFGRPDARLGLGQPGFAELLTLSGRGKVWVKVSGIYRLQGSPEENLAFARQALCALEAHYGAERLMWGSDWPHTQHESEVSFGTAVEQFEALGCSAQLRQALMVDTARALFGFE